MQTIRVDTGDEGTLFGFGSFRFDERGERDYREERRSGRKRFESVGGDLLQGFAEFADHHRSEIGGRGAMRQIVGGGEEKAFEGFCAGCEVLNLGCVVGSFQEFGGFHEVCGFEIVGDVENGVAFLDSEGLLVDFTVGELPENLLAREGMIEEVFAGLERTFGMAAGVNFEGDGAADDAICLEDVSCGALGDTVGNFNEDALRRNDPERLFDGIPKIAGGRNGGEKDEENESEELFQAKPAP